MIPPLCWYHLCTDQRSSAAGSHQHVSMTTMSKPAASI